MKKKNYQIIAGAGGGGGGACFAAGTQVDIPDGTKSIEFLKTGDKIVSYNDKWNFEIDEVESTHFHKDIAILKLHLWGHDEPILVTAKHWFLNEFNRFVPISGFKTEDVLVNRDHHFVPIKSIEYTTERVSVYNIKVKKNKTFIADGILVHNGGGGGRSTNYKIAGAGGGGEAGKQGGGSARESVEDPDSLHSKSVAKIIDLVCEGEIEGWAGPNADPFQSIYFNETVLKNRDGSFNFLSADITYKFGTPDQTALVGYSDVEYTRNIGERLKYGTSNKKTYTITNVNVDEAIVSINFPSLQEIDKATGDIHGSSVSYSIKVDQNPAPFSNPILITDSTVTGKTTSGYSKSHRFTLRSYVQPGAEGWQIIIERTTENYTLSNIQNRTNVDSITEIINSKMRYPYSVIVGIDIDAENFNRIPDRAYHLKGLKVKVPNTYFPNKLEANRYTRDPNTGLETGTTQTWNGGFYVAWTDNPAWIFYDILTNPRYGLGEYINTIFVDKWTLYDIAKFCDETVSDGFGGLERRFATNVLLSSREEGYKVLQDLASAFRGMIYWANNQVIATQDRPRAAMYQFSEANVKDGKFIYSGSAKEARHTVCLVSYNDPNDFYRSKVEYVEDVDAILRYGIRETQITAFGCSSRGQAHRLGKWLLLSEIHETEAIQFSTGLEGIYLKPGDIIQVLDSSRAGVRYGGRITSINAAKTIVEIDAPITLNNWTYTLTLYAPQLNYSVDQISGIQATGTPITPAQEPFYVYMRKSQVETQTVDLAASGGAGAETSRLVVSSAFAQDIPVGSVWVLESSGNIIAKDFRIFTVTEKEVAQEYEINGTEYYANKYDDLENNLKLDPEPITQIPVGNQSAPPSNLTVNEIVVNSTI